MKWTDGRSKGATSVVKRSAVKSGTIAVGENVCVVWGKSKKSYNAEVVDDGSTFQVPNKPRGIAAEVKEPFHFELVEPAPPEVRSFPHQHRQPALTEKIDTLVDTVAGLEARFVRQFEVIVARLDKLQSDVDELKQTRVLTPEEMLPVDTTTTCLPDPPPPPMETDLWQMQSPSLVSALLDVSNRSVGGTQEYSVARDDVDMCLLGCRSRRNLAARLAEKIFSLQERATSNCRGVLGKKALEQSKVKAIHATCMKHFPLERLEMAITAEKDMRNTIDEVCRKTKTGFENQ